MVFENLTLFELNFEDAQFGPESIGSRSLRPTEDDADADDGARTEAAEAAPDAEPDESGRSPVLLGVMILLAVAGVLAVRRFRGSDDDGIDVDDVDTDTEQPVEQ